MTKINPKLLLPVWAQLGWFGCVYFGKLNWGFASLIFPLVSWLLLNFSFGLNRQKSVRLLVLLLVGIVFDSTSAYFNLIQMTPPAEIGWLPLWLISLWLLFASTLPLLQSLFQDRYILAALVGAVIGPLSYRAGAQFETLILNGTVATLVYASFWASYIPIAIFWLRRGDIENENS